MKQVLEALAKLYAAAHGLPDFTLPEDAVALPASFKLTHEDWKALATTIQGLLGERQSYWFYFDPTLAEAPNEEPDAGMLWDDLADIYRDIKPGLHAWDANRDDYLPATVFEWKWPGFYHHWGLHAVDAMRALHWWIEKDGPEPDWLIY